MRRLHLGWVLAATAIAVFGLGGGIYAFHDGGVAECSGCHSMHSSPLGAENLTANSDESSTCLSCHERAGYTGPSSYHISTPASELPNPPDLTSYPKQMTPGGDFGWIRQDYPYSAHGRSFTNLGHERGHNIQALDNAYTTTDGLAPGGTMNSADLACTSCHDPHSRARRVIDGLGVESIEYPPSPTVGGTYGPIVESGSYGAMPIVGEAVGVYRLLGGANYQPPENPDPFLGNPAAVVPRSYNKLETTPADQVRAAYGYSKSNGYTSWALWCGACHPNFHTDNAANTVHVVEEQIGSDIATTYNAYVKTGDLTGVPASSFTSLVPFALNTADTVTLNTTVTTTPLAGPTGTDRILCLTCHRAHASGWKYALRWNMEAEFLTLESGGISIYPGKDTPDDDGGINQGYSEAQMRAAYYDRPATTFAAHQRVLCNKCHNKD